MESQSSHEFSSDRPIKKIEEDLLGRANFSKSLATAISSWHGEDSLVVAIHGDWGSGKSSIKNMAIEYIEKDPAIKPQIIEFSPWEWAAQDKITESFFQEISIAIGRKDKNKDSKKLASALKKYGRYLNTGTILTSGFSSSIPTLILLAATFGIGIWFKNTGTALILVLALWVSALKWGKNFLDSIAENLEISAKDNEKGLSELRTELTELLVKQESPLIIVMDDLDRLTSEQLRMVFQIVKANTEFPNVVFILLFQRDLVEEKLDDKKQTGRDYLEKIIQVSFDIPKIEISRLHKLLFTNLDKLIEQNKSTEKMFDVDYWSVIFYRSLHAYFDNLRSVYRFISTLSFHFSLLQGRTTFEVNPVDLIAIECLRLFEPDVYKEISRSKEIFTRNGSDSYGRSKDITANLIENVVGKSTKGKNEIVRSLLKKMFPNIEWALGGTHYGTNGDLWLKDMRICHPTNFDKYFQFSIPSGELSNSDLQEMLSLTSDASAFSLLILALKEQGIVKNALAQFESYTDEIPLVNGYTYIKALLDVGDKLDHGLIGFTDLSSNIRILRLVVWFIERIESLQERGNLLCHCFTDSVGLSIVEDILMSDDKRRQESKEELLLDDNGFIQLKQLFVKKIDNLAENSSEELLDHAHFGSLIYRWEQWGNSEKVLSWVKLQANKPKGSLKLLKAFTRESSSISMNSYIAKISHYIKLENLEFFVSINVIEEEIIKLDKSNLDEKSLEAIKAFDEAIDRRKRGVSDDF